MLPLFKYLMKSSRISVSKKTVPSRLPKKSKSSKNIDLDDLNSSFSQIQYTKMTKAAAESRRASKLVPVKPKISVPNRDTVNKTTDDLAKLLKDF